MTARQIRCRQPFLIETLVFHFNQVDQRALDMMLDIRDEKNLPCTVVPTTYPSCHVLDTEHLQFYRVGRQAHHGNRGQMCRSTPRDIRLVYLSEQYLSISTEQEMEQSGDDWDNV